LAEATVTDAQKPRREVVCTHTAPEGGKIVQPKIDSSLVRRRQQINSSFLSNNAKSYDIANDIIQGCVFVIFFGFFLPTHTRRNLLLLKKSFEVRKQQQQQQQTLCHHLLKSLPVRQRPFPPCQTHLLVLDWTQT
jgi:hypothetical protein